MLKKLTKIKNIICKIILVFGLISLALFSRINYNTAKSVFAINKEDVSEDFLTTPGFYSTSSSNISSSSHWTTIVPDDENNSSSFKKGIVNVEKIESTITADENATNSDKDGVITDNLWKNFGLFQSPGKISNVSLDEDDQKGVNNYLMINAHNFSGHMGYKSDNFSLEKGSFYKIAVTLKTINAEKEVEVKESSSDELTTELRKSDATTSIYLNGISDKDQVAEFEYINTNNSWQTYYFYINTSTFTKESDISLQLYLGTKTDSCQGAVFFSDIKIEQYSESEYTKEVTPEQTSKSNVKHIDLNTSYVYDLVKNASFESNMNTWSTIGSANNGDIFSTVVDTSSTGHIKGNTKYPEIPSNNNSSDSNIKALAIYSKPDQDTSTYYGVESNTFVIEQYKLYRISVWAYSNSGSSNGAYITILDSDNTDTKVSSQVSTNASTTNALANNWTEYDFYIQGHSLRDSNLKIQLSIGKTDSKDSTENYVIFDDIRVQEINYTQFNSGKTSSNTLTLTPEQSSDYLIKNYEFNAIENNDDAGSRPLTPAEWTLSNESSSVYAGVVNTNNTHFANNKNNYGQISNLINPGKISSSYPIDSNNVLMMGTAKTNQSISYTTTNTFSLSKSSYYKISFDVFTQHLSNSDKGASFTIVDSNNINILNIENIKTNSTWQTYTYYVATDLFDKTCNAVLSLNNVDAYAYFDNIKVSSIDEALYTELVETKDSNLFVNLSQNLFGNGNAWTPAEDNDSAIVSFLQAHEYDISIDNEGIAHIVADMEDVKYHITKTEQLSVEASSYYKLSVYINTKNIRKMVADDNTEYGANFLIKYGDKIEGIENIQTNDQDFEQFIIYFQTADATTVDIMLGLGNDDNKVSGEVAFTKLEITKLENLEAMDADKEANVNIESTTIVAEVAETTEDDTTDETEPYSASPNWLVISSLITSAAMIIAILAFFIRKIKFRKRSKRVVTNYDRRHTLDKRFDMQERIEYRENLITSLNAEIKEIDELKDSYTTEHNAKLSAMNANSKESSDAIKKELQDLYNTKLEISKEHNKLIAKDKLNASKEEDIAYAEKISKIEAQEKALTKKLKVVEKNQNKENSQYDDLISRATKRQDELKAEIKAIKQEIVLINQELESLNKGENK